MISLEALKIATANIFDNERPVFNDDLAIAHDDIVRAIIDRADETERLEDYESETEIDLEEFGYDSYEEYENWLDQSRADEWRDEVYSACTEILEESAGDYMPYMVYTADIMNYFNENVSAVESAHEELGLEGSLSEQIADAVAYARISEVESHVSELKSLFNDSSALEDELGL